MKRSGGSAMVPSLAALPSTHRPRLPRLGTVGWSTGCVSSPMPLWSVRHGWTAVGATSVGLHQSTMPFWRHQVPSAHLVASTLNLMISVSLSMEPVSGIIPVAPGEAFAWVATIAALLIGTTSLDLDLSHSVPYRRLGGWSPSLPASVQSEMASVIGTVSWSPTCMYM